MIEINATPSKKPVEQILNSKTINISNQKEKHRRNDFYVSIQKNKNKIFLNIKIQKNIVYYFVAQQETLILWKQSIKYTKTTERTAF